MINNLHMYAKTHKTLKKYREADIQEFAKKRTIYIQFCTTVRKPYISLESLVF